ncbi:hypothetical protein SK3146_04574 [Paenibacillus konkukensis]|uniref:Uncharacterized protein n=1 Tax=Paenibacillus konkukensis TaxID=2020716 RepID=A0ABY4RTJ5_9BACL|nr:hypothetical protein [Paenibacillus konkukensis]UQZ85285.1 hypothetical protein SK3146_04574 [Paenibacillus konkukensis]
MLLDEPSIPYKIGPTCTSAGQKPGRVSLSSALLKTSKKILIFAGLTARSLIGQACIRLLPQSYILLNNLRTSGEWIAFGSGELYNQVVQLCATAHMNLMSETFFDAYSKMSDHGQRQFLSPIGNVLYYDNALIHLNFPVWQESRRFDNFNQEVLACLTFFINPMPVRGH